MARRPAPQFHTSDFGFSIADSNYRSSVKALGIAIFGAILIIVNLERFFA